MRVDVLRLVGSAQTNKVMEGELSRLAMRALSRRPGAPKRAGVGTLLYPYDEDLAALAVNYHRTSARVLRDVYRVAATRLEPLYEALCEDVRADVNAWWGRAKTLSVTATRTDAFPAGERQVVGTVKNAIIDGLRQRGISLEVDANAPDIAISVRMDDDGAVVVSLDLGGRSLSQRGYRQQAGQAPLREHLAAALVMLSRFDARRELFLDPMCGSGTLAIEAALMAKAAPRKAGLPALFPDTSPMIVANDLDVTAVAAARQNAERAHATSIGWRRGDFRQLTPSSVRELAAAHTVVAEGHHAEPHAAGVILVNPPYDERLREEDILALYEDLGAWATAFRGWRLGVIVDHPGFEQAFGHAWQQKKPLANANLRSYFYLYAL